MVVRLSVKYLAEGSFASLVSLTRFRHTLILRLDGTTKATVETLHGKDVGTLALVLGLFLLLGLTWRVQFGKRIISTKWAFYIHEHVSDMRRKLVLTIDWSTHTSEISLCRLGLVFWLRLLKSVQIYLLSFRSSSGSSLLASHTILLRLIKYLDLDI